MPERVLLIVDNLGVEWLTDWVIEVLFRVFNAQYTTTARMLVVGNVELGGISHPRLRSGS